MLGKLKIRCIYNKNGCQEILLLNNLEKHEKTCRFAKPYCEKCFCEFSVDHDCVKSLLELNQKLIERNSELQKELNSATDKIVSMNSEIENYLQTIQGLTNKNPTKIINIKEVFSSST